MTSDRAREHAGILLWRDARPSTTDRMALHIGAEAYPLTTTLHDKTNVVVSAIRMTSFRRSGTGWLRTMPTTKGSAMCDGKVVNVTPRQREVVKFIALGLSADQIAERLRISVRTVRAHTDALRIKLGVPKARMIPSAYRAATGDDPWQ